MELCCPRPAQPAPRAPRTTAATPLAPRRARPARLPPLRSPRAPHGCRHSARPTPRAPRSAAAAPLAPRPARLPPLRSPHAARAPLGCRRSARPAPRAPRTTDAPAPLAQHGRRHSAPREHSEQEVAEGGLGQNVARVRTARAQDGARRRGRPWSLHRRSSGMGNGREASRWRTIRRPTCSLGPRHRGGGRHGGRLARFRGWRPPRRGSGGASRCRAIAGGAGAGWWFDGRRRGGVVLDPTTSAGSFLLQVRGDTGVARRELQLVGIAAMLIACKYEEIWAAEVGDFISIADNYYSRQQILSMEKNILNSMAWNLTVPTPYVPGALPNMIFFFAEMALMEYELVTVRPSLLAASAVYAARCTLKRSPIWTETLKHHSGLAEPQLLTNTFLLQVVKYLIVAFDIVNSVHEQGNTALHIAAFRGHLPVVEALMTASPSLISARNEVGDTFLHMALTGFRTLGFRRLDRQMELTKHLVSGSIMDVSDVINVQNDDGRTVLHLAVVGNLHSSLVELLMTVPSIDLNVRDSNDMTPLDLLKKQPHTASSEILIKELILAGGISNSRYHETRSAIASQLKMHHIVGSPGTSFRISDAEIFLHAGIDASGVSERTRTRTTSFSSVGKSAELVTLGPGIKRLNSMQSAARHLKVLLR
ncbi:E3 ubiquitin-protein ligase MIB2 [Hordeum vulgare]|nr:E3 ubiquitin-protein ligase MIB2 [Hordeum vulgare]